MSATSKAASLGSGLMLVGVALHFDAFGVTARSVAAIAFIFLTVPVAAHVIGRAAYLFGIPLWRGTVKDDLDGQYEMPSFKLAGAGKDDDKP
jgi:multicomponent Na+:H+ antiporter subunit G